MGSQTLEILRQGVWASLTGGWFYDPHQGVFCNVVHLYLWLFLLCTPFVTYLYFPATLLTWGLYCFFTSLTVLCVKVANMALHRLYDQAQTMSGTSLKNPFFKITKDNEERDDEVGIEMQVMRNDVPSQNSVEQAINEASEENSITSIENANSILDLKVDVHRKNSSESIELMFYAPSVMSSVSQQEQQSVATGSHSVSKSIRSAATTNNSSTAHDINPKFLTVYPEHESELPKTLPASSNNNPNLICSRPTSQLQRKAAIRHQRRRFERQNSLDVAAESALILKLGRSQLDSLSTVFDGYCTETFLHPQAPQQSLDHPRSAAASRASSTTTILTTATSFSASASANNAFLQRLPAPNANTTTTVSALLNAELATTNSPKMSCSTPAATTSKAARLQRHRSSETHDERVKKQARGLFLPIHHEQHHISSGVGSSGALTGMHGVDELELGLGGSSDAGTGNSIDVGRRGHGLFSLDFGSSSDVYLEDDSFTKSDLGIEQLDKRKGATSSGPKSKSAFVLQQQQNPIPHCYQHQQQFLQHRPGTNIRKDSNSTMSALQLPVAAAPPNSKHALAMKRRRHSNATSLHKSGVASGAGAAPLRSTSQQPTVRRIKSAALEIGCPHPSVSNLMPHPNSVEAISGQQQIKNPKSALLPPPSKCLVRNAHLNLCPAYGGGFGSSACGLNFGTNGSGSSQALMDPVYPIFEQADEKASLDLELGGMQQGSSGDLVIHDIDSEEAEDAGEEMLQITRTRGMSNEEDDYDLSHTQLAEHNQLRCQDHAAYEADVRQILDDEDFKASDDNLDDILKEALTDTEKKCRAVQSESESSDGDGDGDGGGSDGEAEQRCGEAAPTSQVSSERLQSSDSETDKNGSRSPLLSGNKGRDRSVSAAADKAMMSEIPAAPPQKPAVCNLLPQHLYKTRPAKGEGDSGCPSSDCEQVSSSSKDMLLSDMDVQKRRRSPSANGKVEKSPNIKDSKGAKEEDLPSASAIACAGLPSGKSLGAIPKVVKCREVDEERGSTEAVPDTISAQQQLHKRRGANAQNIASFGSSASKTISRTSSSASSKSFSADSFSADIHKMLWLMSGGAVDGAGRPITAGSAEDSQSMAAAVNVVPSSMSMAHFQFYQDALNALHSHPSSSVDRLSTSDRMYLREKIRCGSKQVSDSGNLSLGEFSHLQDLPDGRLNGGAAQARSAMNGAAISAVMSSSTLVSGTRHSNSSAPLTIQSLINVINDGRHGSTQSRMGASGAENSASAAILELEGQQIDNYCDYWRPACMLSTEKPVVPKSFYKYRFKLLGFEREVKISMDRLELLALFDRDLHWMHIVLSVVLAGTVSYLGAAILQLGFYRDLFAFLFCAVIAGSQYSLLKSVQPDATSPIHGFNKTVAYSRAVYFSCCGALLLLLQDLKLHYEGEPRTQLVLFGVCYAPLELTSMLLHTMYVLLLSFPLIFSLGLFPQINTFLMYFLEQVDMHVFGGNASSSLLGSFLCVIRSSLGVLILFGPLYAGLAEGKGTQYITFSIFCAMVIPLGYHLSRSASDFSHLWALVKNGIVSTYREDDEEFSAATSSAECQSQKLTASTSRPSKAETVTNDAAAAAAAAVTEGEQIEMSSLEKLPPAEQEENALPEGKNSKSKPASLASSSTTLPKTYSSNRKAATTSNSFTSAEGKEGIGGATNRFGGGAAKSAVRKQRSTTPTEPQANDEDQVSTSSTTNAGDISTLTAGGVANGNAAESEAESPDPLPKKLQNTVNTRLKNDLVVTTLLAVVVFGLHCSTVFSVLQPDLNVVLYAISGALGLLLHYIIPQMRKHTPWQCFARPLLRQKEFGQFEVGNAAKVMWFEKIYIYLCMVERNVLFPLLVISALTADAQRIANKFGNAWGCLIVATCALKFIRNAYSDPTNQYLIVLFTVLFFRVDFAVASETFLIDYFFVSIAFRKCCDFLLKMQFIVTYIAPWQITWGSAFHAFAQPFSVPHSAMLFLQAGISALLSTPLNPFLGSAIFLTSYVRPIKFWERDYNTRRIDHSNTRLSSQLERDLGADDNNLNSIFYEHLTRSLQHSLCGDLLMGRWGNVNQGDCFVLASDYLNCLVHIIELGNGLCTFQMRGLEFRGTYCQQREVEAITEDAEDNDGCCCCDPGHLPRMLSANAMFSTRWLAWQVVAAQYVLEGYSISDNLASATLQVFEYRKVLITYYIKSIIYYVIRNPKLEKWLAAGPIQDALQHTLSRQFVDLDPIFNYNLDEDFDFRALGITRTSFCFVYLGWMQYCWDKRRERQSLSSFVQNSPPVAENSSRSTQTNLTLAHGHSQSHTHLRARPQKSATMSGTGTTAAAAAHSVANTSEHTMPTSRSFANISPQTSESVPGAETGVANGPIDGQTLTSSMAAGAGYGTGRAKAPPKPPKTYDRYCKHGSPTRDTAAAHTKTNNQTAIGKNAPIVSLCLALGLLARRALATASHSSLTGVEFFLHGLHALFKGDFRITSPRDEWVFADMELLHAVVAPAVKMALKLQQDHISNPDEFLDPEALYSAISSYSTELVISHEADPVWRSAVLRGASNLLALRHVLEDGSDEYRIIRLTKRYLSFRVIKLNRECVRGLWAGQQQELIYLRNRNPERGSIQNAKQALRNIINSSCDQPIGYPIYVSPLTTSYADTNEQLCRVIGGAVTAETIKNNLIDWWQRVRERCRQGCSSGSTLDQPAHTASVVVGTGCNINIAADAGDLAPVYISAPLYNTLTVGNFFGLRAGNVSGIGGIGGISGISGISGSLSSQYGSQSLAGVATTRSGLAVMNKPTSTTLLAGLLNREREQEREAVRDPRLHRKGQTQQTSGRTDRERRATLPITSSCLGVLNGAANATAEGAADLVEYEKSDDPSSAVRLENTPRYTKMSSSSGNLGIGNIITTPGEYPRKTKGPISLTAATAEMDEGRLESRRKAPIELFSKVIIVDGTEIYDCLDLGRRIDVVWPNDKMRSNGGRLSWKEWTPRVGMVGYVVHYWIPNHPDKRFRSHVNRTLYLIEIGDHYVPVGEFGVREYHQILEGRENAERSSCRSLVQREYDDRMERERERDGLTPILGSSLESPTIMATSSCYQEAYAKARTEAERNEPVNGYGAVAAVKISTVSSSSSDDEELSNLERRMEMHRRDIMNMMKLMSEKRKDVSHRNDETLRGGSPSVESPSERSIEKIESAEIGDGEQLSQTDGAIANGETSMTKASPTNCQESIGRVETQPESEEGEEEAEEEEEEECDKRSTPSFSESKEI